MSFMKGASIYNRFKAKSEKLSSQQLKNNYWKGSFEDTWSFIFCNSTDEGNFCLEKAGIRALGYP